jgi:hypothetical protein
MRASFVIVLSALALFSAGSANAQSGPNKHIVAAQSISAKAAAPTIQGKWTYRSYVNRPDIIVNDDPQSANKALQLLFGEGIMTLNVGSGNAVTGTFDMGGGYVLDLTGTIESATKEQSIIRLSGPGRPNSPTAGWEYDYVGFLAPQWPAGVNQVPSIVGTVIRAKPHGQAPAGFVASFIAVKQP